jgi:hypothetical protein
LRGEHWNSSVWLNGSVDVHAPAVEQLHPAVPDVQLLARPPLLMVKAKHFDSPPHCASLVHVQMPHPFDTNHVPPAFLQLVELL